uniref:Lipid phosphate phosphatase-related protein type 5-like n=1 Tax=Haplochromis burtoni TaxID=8153 RepID=A0A3Q3BTG4_HAPBU
MIGEGTRENYRVPHCFGKVVVILAATVMLVYYCEFTDTFSPAEQGFICRDPTLTKPDPGPEQNSRMPPIILYSVVTLSSFHTILIFMGKLSLMFSWEIQEKVVVVGDCCYVNPMVRRTVRFLGVFVFGLFTTDIFVSTGQMVTGSLAPYFLSVCQPNYTALGCQDTAFFVSQSDGCTGDPDDIIRARKTFPCKEAALSVYLAVYLAMYIMSCVGSAVGRLAGPFVSLSLVSLALLTGINRVAEYRNHWSDVIAGQGIGAAVAVFLVSSWTRQRVIQKMPMSRTPREQFTLPGEGAQGRASGGRALVHGCLAGYSPNKGHGPILLQAHLP